METTSLFDWILLAAFLCILCAGIARTIILYKRGVMVFAAYKKRTPAQVAYDLVFFLVLVSAVCLIPAYAVGTADLVPAWLSTVLVDSVAAKSLGVALATASLAVYVWALKSFRDSWRIGIDEKKHGALITGGIFAWSRNPIYLSFDLLAAGAFLVNGRLVFALLMAVLVAYLHDYILREEKFLTETYGNEYRKYTKRVGRYITVHKR